MVDIYTQAIAGSEFTEERAKRYHNATLAGPIAFFYFSGSWSIVFGGMALLAMLMSVLELIWARLMPDPLVTAMSGCYLALVILQLSTGVLQAASGILAVTALLALIWGIMRMSPKTAKMLPEQAKAAS
jgi:predicted Co/Zn/Cd cation transporter (cation efflux family)